MMINTILSALVSSEIAEAKRRAGGAAMVLAAYVLLLIAFMFGAIGLYHWLAITMNEWEAALLVSGVVAITAIFLLLVGRLRMHTRRKRDHVDINHQVSAAMHRLSSGAEDGAAPVTPGLLAVAALAGFIIGKKLVK